MISLAGERAPAGIASSGVERRSPMIVLSYIQAKELLAARKKGEGRAELSLDLNRSRATVELSANGAGLPDGSTLPWREIEEIAKNENTCFLIENGAAAKIQQFSPRLNRFYSLKPTTGAPTLLVSGIPMHRIKNIDPHEDTRRKIAAVGPIYGRVLDTTTGLGYTAIEEAKTASEVTTIELDPAVLEIARQNPWSAVLFDCPKITQMVGNSFDIVPTLPPARFDFVVHDPPTISLGGELYSEAFYRELFRVLKPGGRLFHYVGDLASKTGATAGRGAARRLQEAGFMKVSRSEEAFGLTARKP